MGSSCFLHTKTLRHSLKKTAWNSCQHLFSPPPQIKMQKSQPSPFFHPPLMLTNSLLAASTPLLCRKGHVSNHVLAVKSLPPPPPSTALAGYLWGPSASWIASEEWLRLQGQKYHWQETYVAGMVWWDVQHDIQRQWARGIWDQRSVSASFFSDTTDLQERCLSRYTCFLQKSRIWWKHLPKFSCTPKGISHTTYPHRGRGSHSPQQPYLTTSLLCPLY